MGFLIIPSLILSQLEFSRIELPKLENINKNLTSRLADFGREGDRGGGASEGLQANPLKKGNS